MDLETIILISIYFSCILVILRVVKGILPKKDGWIIFSGIIFVITLILSLLDSPLNSWLGGSFCLMFLWIPPWVLSWVNRLIEVQNYKKASQLFSSLYWLHPTPIWRDYLQLIIALEMAKNGQIEAGIKQLQSSNQSESIIAYYRQVLIYEITADWQGCLQWFDSKVKAKILWNDATLLTYYIRCLGETGQLNRLFKEVLAVESKLLKLRKLSKINLLYLYVFAFSGQIFAVQELFKQSLFFYPQELQEFWLLTAKMAINPQKDHKHKLLKLCSNNNQILSNAIHWRLNQSPLNLKKSLNETSCKTLYFIQFQTNKFANNSLIFTIKKQKITQIIIVINVLVFIAEINLGGSENIETLYDLGALVPMMVWEGQFWRLITANFLHYGWLHLLMNMIGLYVVGGLVESLSQTYRYLIIYFTSGIGAMFLFSYLAIYTNNLDYILVGASASIMGLVGSLTAIFLRKWWQEKSSINRKRFLIMLMMLGLQFISDFLIPQVSIMSHLFGFMIGFFLELMLFSFVKSPN
ncbi:rhomboid family intramembrane serine protease [Crocosphaera sp. XPORK-15E]|uniref:rhomboid family intramembrane serine protease n=1 Tax=Crocosphaera sp. XPORK-15E TaxID=3110247 RepID=UPI002B1E9AFB|nr:rhomboid family intramembrane serine protease [Crocosphaera sp. XPORK-15E]MEA5533282.1 rhomboid family intramembrane serine protease [Crocosphaera sp. XPORK-15E]